MKVISIVKKLTLMLFLILLTASITACASNVASSSPEASLTITSVTPPIGTSTPSQTPAPGQQIIIEDILKELKQQGVLVKDTRLVNFTGVNPPIELEFTLQSSSNDLIGTPEDALNYYLVMRTANLAQRKGLNVGAIGMVLINNQGQRMNSSGSAVTKINDLPLLDSTPSPLDDATVSNLLKQKIFLSAPCSINIKISQGIYGLREAIFDIQVPDLQTANNNISIVSSIMVCINNLNLNQDAQISDFRINITETAGHPLLKLMGDSRGSITAWRIDGLANWGYPQPPPASSAIQTNPS